MTTLNRVLAVLGLGLLIVGGYSYMKEHEAKAVVAVQMKADKDAAEAIAAKEKDNQQALADALKNFAAMKKQVQTPTQVVEALPKVVTLPTPITEVSAAEAQAVNAVSDGPRLQSGDLIIPAESAKPFFDAQVDCKANEAKLSSCQVTVSNQADLMAVKDREVGQLQESLKGGTKWQRAKSALKFIGVGVAVGAATSAYFLTR